MFKHGFTQQQVDGLENLLDVWEQCYAQDPLDLLAYNLATAFHETAGTMQPIKERGPVRYFDKYEPGTKLGKVLGNTMKGDGYRFRGEGHVQNTGRRNAAFASKRLNDVFGLGVDLVKDPAKRGDPFISAHSLFLGNKEGWWTGKDLLDFLDGEDEDDAEDLREFINARRVVNGTDKATKIAHHAIEFEHALRSAGYGAPRPVPGPKPEKDAPAQIPQPQVSTAAPGRPGLAGAIAAVVTLTAAARAFLENLPCQWLGVFCGG
ncbi:MAG TPA: hypothetical protein VGO22_01110 [Pseudorhizobium sp.]|jgi:hypothetical protein|nr:hypothetical protein [Pseudorhizobium sp.]